MAPPHATAERALTPPLARLKTALESVDPWDALTVGAAIERLAVQEGVRGICALLRTVLTARDMSGDVMEILGKDAVLRRLGA